MKKLLVPQDFSATSNSAARVAGDLAALLKAKLVLLYVHRAEHVRPEFQSGDVTFQEMQEERKKLDKVAERLRTVHPGLDVETHAEIGKPVECILEQADNRGVDAIVMGTHGRKGIAAIALGSVAESVVRQAKVPVLVTKAGAVL